MPCRYTELKALATGANDSTVSRLLHDLERLKYLRKVSDIGYCAGPELAHWQDSFRRNQSLSEILQQAVETLSEQTLESAAVAILEETRIHIPHSISYPEGISVVAPGGWVHFEADHAASVCILNQIPMNERDALFQSPSSRIKDEHSFQAIQWAWHRPEGLVLDRSSAREGVCRLGAPIKIDGKPGALFLCLTQQSAEIRWDTLSTSLLNTRDQLEKILKDSERTSTGY